MFLLTSNICLYITGPHYNPTDVSISPPAPQPPGVLLILGWESCDAGCNSGVLMEGNSGKNKHLIKFSLN